MKFQAMGDPQNPVILFFHAMGVTGESSFRVAEYLKEKYFCVMPTSTVYCPGQIWGLHSLLRQKFRLNIPSLMAGSLHRFQSR